MVGDAKKFNDRTRRLKENAKEFAASSAKLADLIEVDSGQFVRAIVLMLWVGVIEKTPRDTGKAKNNWQIGTSTNANEKGEGFGETPEIPKAIEEAATIFIFNNAEYIDVLEFGGFKGSGPKVSGGFSTQAPEGMLAVTLKEVSSHMAAEAKRLGYLK